MRARDGGGIAVGLAVVTGGVILLVVLVGAAASVSFRGSSPGGVCGQARATVTSSTGLDPEQLASTRVIVGVAAQMRLPERAAVIAVATAMQESGLRDLDHGDRDSLGLFQQRPSQGWGTPAQILNPVYASSEFYMRLTAIPGWQTLPLTVAAQDVQRSGVPAAYSVWETFADTVVADVSGGNCATPGRGVNAAQRALTQLGKPYIFSWGPGGEITLNPSVCPAQMPDSGSSANTAGAVDSGLTTWQRCAAARVILFAAGQLGKPYAWGAAGPDAFDCSGLAMMAYRAVGIAIPRTSQEQWATGTHVPPGQEEPGDLVFFAGSDGTVQAPGHVGIALGGGMMIDAPFTGADVRVDQVAGEVGFTRPAAAG